MNFCATKLSLSVLLATTLAQAQARPVSGEERYAKIYDLDELLEEAASPSGPELHLGLAQDLTIATAEATAEGRGTLAIARLIEAFVQPELRPNEQVQALGEQWLVVLGRSEQHAWIDRLLAAARSREPAQIRLRCHLYSLPEITYQRDVAQQVASDPTSPNDRPGIILAPGAKTTAFREALAAHPEVTQTDLPTVTLSSMASAQISALNQTAYVRDFELEVAKTSMVANPVVDVVQNGVSIQASAMAFPAGGTGLSFDLQVTDLKRPIPTHSTTLPGTTLPVTIQTPSVLSSRIEIAMQLQEGQVALLAMKPLGGLRHLVTVEVEPPNAADK